MESQQQPTNGHMASKSPEEQHAPQQGQAVQNPNALQAELLWKLRKYLMLLAILAAAITYQAGLSPPGGFWQDNLNDRIPGDIVLRVSYPKRYYVFFYCNTTAFGASLIVLILLLVRELSRNVVWLRALQSAMVLGLLGLMGAYAAGSCREVRTSVYIWVLLVGIFAYITLHVIFFRHLAPKCLWDMFMNIRKYWKDILASIFRKTQSNEPETPMNDREAHDEGEELERNRSFLLVLATLAATVTYVAGLSPPGGFWPHDEKPNHLAGDPVLQDHYPRRFKAFMVCNATSFAGSLVIIIMLLSNTAVDHVVKSNALRLCVLVSLFGLMGAYAAGSCREVRTSIYVFSLIGAVLIYLALQWIEPIVTKPECIEKSIGWMRKKKTEVLQKLSSFIVKGSGNPDDGKHTTLSGPNTQHTSNNFSDAKDDIQKLRTYLLLLGILAATVTYQAGLNPPGGFWADNNGHIAGDPILETMHPRRYKVFFYCNATAFVASLVIITLLQSQLITVSAMKRHILQTAMTLDLFGLMGAYAAGSSRKFSTSLYVFVLVLLVFTYVVIHVMLSLALKRRLRRDDAVENEDEEKDLEKRRKFLMLLAILAASITYQAGISPPGGFWSDNNGHQAGDPVFHDEFPTRYRVFFYFNATAFMASLVVIMLLVSKRLCHKGLEVYALHTCVLVDLISLMGAFAAGSCRKVSTSVYVILVVVAVSVYVMIQVVVLTFAKDKVNNLLGRIGMYTFRSSVLQQPSMNHERSIRTRKRTEHKWRKDLMLIGTLAVTVTYQAGLLPPGGFWPDDKGAAGSCREVHTSIYVFTLVAAILLYLAIQWIAPILPRPEFVSKCIKWIKGEKDKLILKLKSLLMESNSTTNEQEMPLALDQQHTSNHVLTDTVNDTKDDMRKLRTYLLLLGILAATITYQAGLNPPGGFWLDNEDGHRAGNPILEAISPKQYNTFFYCNSTAFVSSLVIITLLQSNLITVGALKRYVLQTAMIFDLFGMMGAYAAGSSRTFSTSLYVMILVFLVFSYVMVHVLLFVSRRSSDDGPAQEIDDNPELKDLEKRRKFLVLLAVLAASSTYQAGINPPGGFWPDNNDGHRAGYPMFHDEFPRRYMAFFYLNSTAFMSSLAVIMLLVSKRLCQSGINSYLLRGCMLLDLVSLMGAFAAGSCRKVSTSVYAILVVAVVFAYVMAQVLVLTFAKDKVNYFFEWVLRATPFKSPHPSQNGKRSIMASRKSEYKWRKDLILIGTLAVSVTYQAGLLPPGGLWPDDRDGHFTGDPILHDTDPPRYKAFFYCNATAFMASVVIVILLLNSTISKYKRSLLPMKTAMVLDLLALLGAYAAGSCRKLKTSIYVFALVIAVFMYIVIHVLLSFDKMARLVKKTGEHWIPCLKKMWALIETEPTNHQPSSEEP